MVCAWMYPQRRQPAAMQASSLILLFLFAAVAVVDLIIAGLAFQRGQTEGRSLGLCCIGAFAVTACYTASLFAVDYFSYSVLSSIYFAGNDFTLVFLMRFTWQFTRERSKQKSGILSRILRMYLVFDVLVLAVNPFWEIVISYVPVDAQLARYSYEMKTLYHVHLIYTYLLVAMVLYYLIRKVAHAPRLYRSPSLYCIFTIAAIVGLNAIYRL